MSCCIIGCPNEGATASKETTYHLFPHPVKGSTDFFIIFFQFYCFFRSNFKLYWFISDASRFNQWLNACNNPRFQQYDAMTIHRRYRICRRHFDSDCLNGGCRRLLNTAVPSLHLEPSESESVRIDESGNLSVEPNVVYLSVAQEVIENDEQIELIIPEEERPVIAAPKVKSKCADHFMCCKLCKFRSSIFELAYHFSIEYKRCSIGCEAKVSRNSAVAE